MACSVLAFPGFGSFLKWEGGFFCYLVCFFFDLSLWRALRFQAHAQVAPVATAQANNRRDPRFQVLADAEAVDLQSGARVKVRVENISRSGCYLLTSHPFITWSHLKLQIQHNSQCCTVEGIVVHMQRGHGMGFSFDKFSPQDQAVLEAWLRELSR